MHRCRKTGPVDFKWNRVSSKTVSADSDRERVTVRRTRTANDSTTARFGLMRSGLASTWCRGGKERSPGPRTWYSQNNRLQRIKTAMRRTLLRMAVKALRQTSTKKFHEEIGELTKNLTSSLDERDR